MEKTDTIYKAWGIEEGVHEACGLKPMLSAKGLIESLKAKGVTFDRCSEEDAIRSLLERDTYLHLASYRKLFQKHLEGERKGQYVRLDFADLLDLDELDSELRRTFQTISNDVERLAKTNLLNRIANDPNEDGYSILADFIGAQNKAYRNSIERNLASRARSSEKSDAYTGDLIKHYESAVPVWVFLEVVSFGVMLAFMLFCANRWAAKDLKAQHYILTDVKDVRNCCSHGSCIVNGLSEGLPTPYKTSSMVTQWLTVHGIKNTGSRRSKLSNRRIQQLVTTLVAFDSFSGFGKDPARNQLVTLKASLIERSKRYGDQNTFVSFLLFLAKVIDSMN